jgi:hypothetical protein
MTNDVPPWAFLADSELADTAFDPGNLMLSSISIGSRYNGTHDPRTAAVPPTRLKKVGSLCSRCSCRVAAIYTFFSTSCWIITGRLPFREFKLMELGYMHHLVRSPKCGLREVHAQTCDNVTGFNARRAQLLAMTMKIHLEICRSLSTRSARGL